MYKLLTLIISLITIFYNYKKKRFISSSSSWVFCYVLIFVIFPIVNSDLVFYNQNKIDKYSFLGMIMFFIGLVLGSKIVIKKNTNFKKGTLEVPNFNVSLFCFIIFLSITLGILIYKLQLSGIISILNGNLTSKRFALELDSSSSAFVFSVHLLFPCVLSVWISAKDKKKKRISFICLAAYLIINLLFVFTRIFIITLLAIILIYEIRCKSNFKQFFYLVIGASLLILFMISLNYIRTFGFKSHVGFSNIFDFNYIFESTDFSASYYWFDELLNYDAPYIRLTVYLKPIFAFIPRSIWSNKPEPLSLQILKQIDPLLAASGYSTAGNSVLGEGYAIAGNFGMILFPFIWGTLCGKLDKNYFNRLKYNNNRVVLRDIYFYIFEVFVIMSAQRGDWSQYMTIVIWFYMLPLYIMSKISTKFH